MQHVVLAGVLAHAVAGLCNLVQAVWGNAAALALLASLESCSTEGQQVLAVLASHQVQVMGGHQQREVHVIAGSHLLGGCLVHVSLHIKQKNPLGGGLCQGQDSTRLGAVLMPLELLDLEKSGLLQVALACWVKPHAFGPNAGATPSGHACRRAVLPPVL